LSHLAQFFLERESFQPEIVEEIRTRILCSVTLFRTPCRLCDNVETYGRAR